MTDVVPRLVPRPLSPTVRLLSRLSPGIRSVTSQIVPYTAWWDDRNQEAMTSTGPLLVAVGDSTAIGVGADRPEDGYVGILHRRLSEHHGVPWRVVNLALSGARIADALDRQMPVLDRLQADVVVCCVGTNDLVWGAAISSLRDRLRTLVSQLPDEAVIGELAGASLRAQLANRALRNAAGQHGLPLVEPWAEPGPSARARLSSDGFHPNNLGYRLMAEPFCRQLGLPGDSSIAGDQRRIR